MNGTSYTIPFGMIFKKHYCAKCGAKLEKEKTHRVVTKDDKDYYLYHNFGHFPRRDYDVYEHRFLCPECGARASYNEQCVMERIQKKYGDTVLSSSEIQSAYAEETERHRKSLLLKRILFTFIFVAVLFVLYCICNADKSPEDLAGAALLFVIMAVVMFIKALIRDKRSK